GLGGDRPDPAGPGATGRRPVARCQRRRYCGHGGGGGSSSGGAPMSFSLQKDKRGVVVVGVDGQLIVGNRQELKQKVLDSLDGGGRKFVVDFTKTGYIDTSGLGVLVSLSKKIREQGGDLRLAGLNEDLQTLFELTKLDTLFAIAYGNRHDTSRLVRVRVEAYRHGVRIHVRDDGAGFDPAAVPDPTLPQNLEREVGRGLFVLRHLVDHVAFNATGNEICLTLRAG